MDKRLIEELRKNLKNITSSIDETRGEEKLALKEKKMLIESQLEAYKKRQETLVNKSNLGRRFKDRSFENFDRDLQPEAYDIAYRYAVEFSCDQSTGLMLVGNPGTGKTHLAAAITNYIIEKHEIPVKFGNFIDILNDIKRSFHSDEDIVTKLKEVPLLVIDDLGKERKSEWSESIIYDVITGRYENYMPTIITTNLSMAEIEERFGEATMSRLLEMCYGVVMVGNDYRRKIAAERENDGKE